MVNYNSLSRLVKTSSALLIMGVVLAVCIIYWPGLNGPYVLDDGENILLNPSVALNDLAGKHVLAALTGNDSGPLKRPLAAVSFAFNHYFNSGFYPTFAFKATNLAIHILNTCLIYLFCLKLLRTPRLSNTLDNKIQQRVAIFATALWALHPIQLTNILYVVQRMNSLSALFVLTGLILFVHGRTLLDTVGRAGKGTALMIGGVLGGTVLGLTSKENAALLPLFALVIEYCLFRFWARKSPNRRFLLWFYILIVALPAVSLVAYLAFNPDLIHSSYATRHFSLLERTLTETRILWSYVGLIVFPVSRHFGLFHDDVVLSTNLFTPISTVFAVTGILVALAVGLTQAKRHPVIALAILWFLTGHIIESSFLGLELAYEHRNYLPSYGIIFAVAYGLIVSARSKHLADPRLLTVILIALSFVTWTRANAWGDIQSLAEYTVKNHPNSPRANDFAARTSLGVNHDLASAMRFTLDELKLAPKEVGYHIDLQILLNKLSTVLEHKVQRQYKQNTGRHFDLHVTGLDTNLQAFETRKGIHLAYHGSSPEIISELLKKEPISVHGIFSLENLRHCILDTPRPCSALHDMALKWFTIAADNPHTSRDYRAVIDGNTAMLYADAGNIEKAFVYINRATLLLPEHSSYQVAKAEYLIRLGRLEEAKQIIDRLAVKPVPSDTSAAEYEANIRKLQKLYKKQIKETPISHQPQSDITIEGVP